MLNGSVEGLLLLDAREREDELLGIQLPQDLQVDALWHVSLLNQNLLQVCVRACMCVCVCALQLTSVPIRIPNLAYNTAAPYKVRTAMSNTNLITLSQGNLYM